MVRDLSIKSVDTSLNGKNGLATKVLLPVPISGNVIFYSTLLRMEAGAWEVKHAQICCLPSASQGAWGSVAELVKFHSHSVME